MVRQVKLNPDLKELFERLKIRLETDDMSEIFEFIDNYKGKEDQIENIRL